MSEKQMMLLPPPSKHDMIKEMQAYWLDYIAMQPYTMEKHDEYQAKHKKYYRHMYRIKELYGLPYYELRSYLRSAEDDLK